MVFGDVVRRWRKVRKLSQFELALMASVSQRHLSCLETGRSRPSRPMVMQLAEALDIPLRDRNELLSSAGFAKIYRESGLDHVQMASVRLALEQILDKHEPYPCVVVDRFWNIVSSNNALRKLISIAGELDVDEKVSRNLALLTLHPKGLRPFIVNFEGTVAPFVQRLRRDMLRYSDPETEAFFETVRELIDDVEVLDASSEEPLMPTLSLEMQMGQVHIALFSVIATFGTPQDITTDELRIESFFPADEDSKLYLQALADHH
ncbi:MAG: helix-turn-helix domain-containing protein [Gammaproteobacteria bacterium]